MLCNRNNLLFVDNSKGDLRHGVFFEGGLDFRRVPDAPLNAPQNIKINLVTFWTKMPPN